MEDYDRQTSMKRMLIRQCVKTANAEVRVEQPLPERTTRERRTRFAEHVEVTEVQQRDEYIVRAAETLFRTPQEHDERILKERLARNQALEEAEIDEEDENEELRPRNQKRGRAEDEEDDDQRKRRRSSNSDITSRAPAPGNNEQPRRPGSFQGHATLCDSAVAAPQEQQERQQQQLRADHFVDSTSPPCVYPPRIGILAHAERPWTVCVSPPRGIVAPVPRRPQQSIVDTGTRYPTLGSPAPIGRPRRVLRETATSVIPERNEPKPEQEPKTVRRLLLNANPEYLPVIDKNDPKFESPLFTARSPAAGTCTKPSSQNFTDFCYSRGDEIRRKCKLAAASSRSATEKTLRRNQSWASTR